MMNVTLKYFAGIRETLGRPSEQICTQATTLGELRDELIALGGAYSQSLARGKAVRLALNQVMADEALVLSEGAEVAFFPPVTGG
ncbi:molybdopterin synthase sulfur carrier subunit [mine drainage metagenome]|uniref:Molybdopterin synthase sulfur carrier subunit n=1 Tax=mine drainage metagenome TaxID=410659 RepID=A0A1J5PLZ5_9ZZZZ